MKNIYENLICPYCKKKLKTKEGVGSHLKNHKEIPKIERKFELIRFNLKELNKFNLNKEWFSREYIELEKSPKDIADEIGLTQSNVRTLCEYWGIHQRTSKEAMASGGRAKRKTKETCLSKYGAINPLSKDTIPYKKRNETVKQRYNIDNVFQLKNHQEKSEKTFFKKNGLSFSSFKSIKAKETWLKKSEEEKEEWLLNSLLRKDKEHHSGGISLLEKKIGYLLLDMGVEFKKQFYIKDPTSKKRRFYDYYIPKLNLIIEINGSYWHADPIIYRETDIISGRGGIIPVSSIWENDKLKKETAINKGYKLIYLWESEIINKNDEQIVEILKNKIRETLNESNQSEN